MVCKIDEVIHREVRIERQNFFILSIHMSKAPAIRGIPISEREQSMAEQILRRSRCLALLKISRARDELMPVGQYPPPLSASNRRAFRA